MAKPTNATCDMPSLLPASAVVQEINLPPPRPRRRPPPAT
uniref:Uncharacterized protein n=1 Tax=Arundo donax TaxID=35708 RepID=A0A0A9EES4_ARUDO